MKQVEIEGVRFNCTFDGETETMTAIEDGEDERFAYTIHVSADDLAMGIVMLLTTCNPLKRENKEDKRVWANLVHKHRFQRIANGFES